jgi:hypothetical protein
MSKFTNANYKRDHYISFSFAESSIMGTKVQHCVTPNSFWVYFVLTNSTVGFSNIKSKGLCCKMSLSGT